jgi:hypothetical protein
MTQTGLNAQYTSAAGGGHEGSSQYAVAYTMGAQTEVFPAGGASQTVTGCYITNNLWAYQNMLEGDYTATPFGGTTGNDPDWFKLTATGKNSNGQTTGTVDFYLADYRFANNEEDYILNTWAWLDLSPLGEVASISFSLSSSKNDNYGMITPAYFCMDDFNGDNPNPEDLPPYIVNPLDDVIFNDFPETININLDGVATDDDNPDEDIVYSLVTNSNGFAIAAEINGKTLTINRLNEEAATANLTLRATSNGLYTDFNIHVIVNHFASVGEHPFITTVYPNPTEGLLTLRTDKIERFEYQVFDMTGQLIISGQAQNGKTTIDLSRYNKGVYFISLIGNEELLIQKVVLR